MALLGVNMPSDRPRSPTKMETIAMGVEAASKILGTAADLYSKTIGPGADLQKAQANQANAEAKYYDKKPEIEKATRLQEAIKNNVTQQGYELASPADADPTKKAVLIDPDGTSVWVKHGAKLKQEQDKERFAMSNEATKLFGSYDEVQRQKIREEAAGELVKLAAAKPSKASSLAFLANFIKLQQPTAKFNNDTISGVEAGVSSTLDQAMQKWKQLYSSEGGTLGPNEINDILGTAATQYSIGREKLENRWQEYLNTAKKYNLDIRGYDKPVQFPVQTNSKVTEEQRLKFLGR